MLGAGAALALGLMLRRFARRRLIASATAIHVLQFGAGQFTHDLSPPLSRPWMSRIGGFPEQDRFSGICPTGKFDILAAKCGEKSLPPQFEIGVRYLFDYSGRKTRASIREDWRIPAIHARPGNAFANVLCLRIIGYPRFGQVVIRPDHARVSAFHVLERLY